ncbi:hypothetical protein BGZ70_009810 [Mortierella alpina]|uniref:Uncharacterized protein n=1 Tax=Mortierella alpina TaxID=64518 RepID=A0A9P6J137_MORAP|nr:hypothetical protein BGZ70_009810 [Mortierella alpina]
MLSALSHTSISSTSASGPMAQQSSSDISPSSSLAQQQKSSGNTRDSSESHSESSAMAEDTMDDQVNGSMDYSIEIPIHPLASGPRSPPSHSTSYTATPQPQQHQQLVKLKTEHGLAPPLQHAAPHKPDVVMTEDDADEEAETAPIESSPRNDSASQERIPLMVDTSPNVPHGASTFPGNSAPQLPMSSPNAASTPTPDSGVTAPSSSRRGSLRTMPATLPRSALQEETIALFKQYRNLIPCAKCFSRNTIQRDGMSDGNLRFKCRPPVSMSLICNKSYSESKIRNMVAGVVYGHSLPDSGTPTSASSSGPSSDNVLALAPPPSAVPRQPRRPSHKNEDQEDRDRKMLLLQDRESAMMAEHQQSFEEMNINGGHHHPLDDRRMSLAPSRRGSVQQHMMRHPSLTNPDSPMMDGDGSDMLQPSNQLQVPGSPLMEGEDSRRYRPYGNRPVTPTGAPPHPLSKKLHHSHSHPNIGQHRHQQYLEQQEQLREHRSNSGYSPQAQQYHTHQQNQLQRQISRRESTHYHGSLHHARPDATADRRFSHPAALQPPPSSSSKHLPVGSQTNDSALSPAMSTSSRSSPGRESQQQSPPGEAGTPQIGPISGPGGRYEEVSHSASYYQRRMSQPHPTSQLRSIAQLPPPPPGSSAHYYDRRASDVEDLNGHLREKYEKLHASTMRHPESRSKQQTVYSPRMPYSQSSIPQSLRMPGSECTRYSHSQSTGNDRNTHQGQQASSGIHYQQPSTDVAHRELSPDGAEDRTYARVRQSFQRGGHGHSLVRSSSNPNLYSTSMSSATSSKDLNSVLPCNTIKLTCFPNATSPTNLADSPPSTVALDTSNALALQLSKSSKVVIEITQPRGVQAFEHSPRSSTLTAFNQTPGPLVRSIRHSASHPNLLVRSASSILGRRRSASPDGDEYDSYGASKKRRAEPLLTVRVGDDEGDGTIPMTTASASAAAAEAAAAAVVAAAASAARRQNSNKEACLNTPALGGLQIVGVDFTGNKADGHKAIGLGVQVPNCGSITSPALEALDIAKASSYTALEDQKELGIDYSQFTRVETAGWRILIPPNVVASFRSEDFGLVLKPKVEETEAEPLTSDESEMSEAKKIACDSMEGTDPQVDSADEAMEEDVTLVKQDTAKPCERQLTVGAQESAMVQDAGAPACADVAAEHEMDELEDD